METEKQTEPELTNTIDLNNPNEIYKLSQQERLKIQKWIDENIIESKTKCSLTSYGLKHLFSDDKGFYINNGMFKGAMKKAGYQPINENNMNWIFKLKVKKECVKRLRV